MRQTIIYALCDPRDGSVRYVGQSVNGKARAYVHYSPTFRKGSSPRAAWVNELVTAGLEYRIIVLEEVEDAAGLNEAEMRWIAQGRAAGWPLTNATDGGAGTSGYRHRSETIQQLSAARRARPSASPETRAKISAAGKGRKHTAEARNAISAAKLGVPRSPETVEKIRLARMNRGPVTEETRHKMAEAHRGKVFTEETKIKQSRGNGGRPFLELSTGKIFQTYAQAAAALGITHDCVRAALRRESTTKGGFSFSYLNPA